MILTQCLALVATGIGIGVAASWFLSRFLTTLLFEIAPADPIIFAMFAAVLMLAALLAAAIPARRAARIDPIAALQAGE